MLIMQQGITCIDDDQDTWCYRASPCHNGWTGPIDFWMEIGLTGDFQATLCGGTSVQYYIQLNHFRYRKITVLEICHQGHSKVSVNHRHWQHQCWADSDRRQRQWRMAAGGGRAGVGRWWTLLYWWVQQYSRAGQNQYTWGHGTTDHLSG